VESEPQGDPHARSAPRRFGLDVVLGVCAVLISVISLFVAIHQSQVMDKMMQADTWPYLDFVASNLDDAGHENVSLTVLNSGVGPAKIESIEVTYDGTPLHDVGDLLRRCCVPKGVPVQCLAATVSDRVLPPKEPLMLFSAKPATLQAASFARLDQARARIQARVCYCSALDRCWMRDTTKRRAEEVGACPVPKTPFGRP
jgi:hypothetical protein